MHEMMKRKKSLYTWGAALLLVGAIVVGWSVPNVWAVSKDYRVVIVNQSPVVLAVLDSTLEHGEWTAEPVAGQCVVRGRPVAWQAVMVDRAVSGRVRLTPVSGGEVSVEFAWRDGQPPEGDARCRECSGLRVWITRQEAPAQTSLYVNVGAGP